MRTAASIADVKARLSEFVRRVKAGNEVVLFRHEKTFYNKPGVFVKVTDDLEEAQIKTLYIRVACRSK